MSKSQTEYEYTRQIRREAMRGQVTTFGIMIFLTLISFSAVAAGFSVYFIVPVLLITRCNSSSTYNFTISCI